MPTQTDEQTAELAELRQRLQTQEAVIADKDRQIEATSAVATRANRARKQGADQARQIREDFKRFDTRHEISVRDALAELIATLEASS